MVGTARSGGDSRGTVARGHALARPWTGRWLRIFLGFAILGIAIATPAAPAGAQDPGLEIHSGDGEALPPALRARVEDEARRTLTELVPKFRDTAHGPIRIVLHRSTSGLERALREELHEGTPGFALLGRDEIHLLLDEISPVPPGDLGTVLRHELVHVLLDQFAGDARRPYVPRWLHEGIAQVLSDFTYLGSSEESLVYLVTIGRLPRLSNLEQDFPATPYRRRRAYAFARSFTSFLIDRHGFDTLLDAVADLDEAGFATAWARQTRRGIGVDMERWREHLLHDSGAPWRFLFNNCFSYLMIASVILVALAVARRLERERRIRRRLEHAEFREQELARLQDEEHPTADPPAAETDPLPPQEPPTTTP